MKNLTETLTGNKPSREVVEQVLKIIYHDGSVADDYNYNKDIDFVLGNWNMTDNDFKHHKWIVKKK